MVATASWITVVVISTDFVAKVSDPTGYYTTNNRFRLDQAKEAGYSEQEISEYLTRQALTDFLRTGLLPPVGALVLGIGAAWVWRGFKQRSE